MRRLEIQTEIAKYKRLVVREENVNLSTTTHPPHAQHTQITLFIYDILKSILKIYFSNLDVSLPLDILKHYNEKLKFMMLFGNAIEIQIMVLAKLVIQNIFI